MICWVLWLLLCLLFALFLPFCLWDSFTWCSVSAFMSLGLLSFMLCFCLFVSETPFLYARMCSICVKKSKFWNWIGYLFANDALGAMEKYGWELVDSVMSRAEAVYKDFSSIVSHSNSFIILFSTLLFSSEKNK